jgi:serine/threonine-protein kinase RsbT
VLTVSGVADGQAELLIEAEADLIAVRQILRGQAEAAGLGLVDSTKLITAGSELARNILNYATGARGRFRAEVVRSAQGQVGVRADFADDGPGIADLPAAMTDGFSTNGSLGLGLPGTKRLVDDFDIASGMAGTMVTVVKWGR